MFTVICTGPKSKVGALVAQGVSFGHKGAPIVFHVTTPQIEVPLAVNFNLKSPGEEEAGTIVVGNIEDNTVEVSFYTGTENGQSGLIDPAGIVAIEGTELLMTFRLQQNSKAPDYIMYYAFFESSSGEVSK